MTSQTNQIKLNNGQTVQALVALNINGDVLGSGGGGPTMGVEIVTSGGSYTNPPTLVYGSAPAFQIDGVDVVYPGAAVSEVLQSGANDPTSVSFNNMAAFIGTAAQFITPSTAAITVSFPDLKYLACEWLAIPQTTTTLDLSALEFARSGIVFNPVYIGLSVVDLSSIQYIGRYLNQYSLIFDYGGQEFPSITEVTLTSELKTCLGIVRIYGQALTEACVDNILVRLAALDGTNGTTVYQNQEVTLSGGTSATPSATGLAAKAVLEARGCTVTVN